METTKLTVAFRNFANATKNGVWVRVICNTTPCGWARVSRHLEDSWCFHQPSWTFSPTIPILCSFETSEAAHPATQLHTAAELNPPEQHCANFNTSNQYDITCEWYGHERHAFKYPPRICLQERVDSCDLTHCSHFHYVNRPGDLRTHQQYKYG
jgi:hypothetical protein